MTVHLQNISAFLTGMGLTPSLIALVGVIVVAWICVDFYEEHFG